MRRRLSTLLLALTLALMLSVGLSPVLVTPSPAVAAPRTAPSTVAASTSAAARLPGKAWPGHPDRRLITYRVKRGDTGAGIATKFHAWTGELRRLNGKGPSTPWYLGERITVPVVVSRTRAAGDEIGVPAGTRRPAAGVGKRYTRTQVRATVVRIAKRYGVPKNVALAVAWHESGWQQQVTSNKGAIGTMQIMPGNRRWLSALLGRQLRLRDLQDNVTAGVVMLKLLRKESGSPGYLAGYYQGTGAVKRYGYFPETRRYIANVAAVHQRLKRGWRPDLRA